MKIKQITLTEYSEDNEEEVEFTKEDIIATETGHTDNGEWITIWYRKPFSCR